VLVVLERCSVETANTSGTAMTMPQLDERTTENLGQNVRVFADQQMLFMAIAIMGVGLTAFGVIGYLDGDIKTEGLIYHIVALPLLLGFTYAVGWWIQFRRPFMAVGSRGVAFPMACHEVIPWSNIDSIETSSECTVHGRHVESHVAVALKLKSGSLEEYRPTLRSKLPLIGYRSHYSRNIVLLSKIYCPLSPEKVLDILAGYFQKAGGSGSSLVPLFDGPSHVSVASRVQS
jgi:hypothetical protein